MLTRNSRKTEANGKICDNADYNVVLAGNPNVGKSTIFNALTGMNSTRAIGRAKPLSMQKGAQKSKTKVFPSSIYPAHIL